MLIIWGIGHKTSKAMGSVAESLCGRCNNRTARQLIKLTSWFSLFFIPIIPYRKQYLLICPICGQARELTRPEFESLATGLQPIGGQFQQPLPDNVKYAGKTPTQIAFLKQMDEINAAKNAEQN